MEADDVAQVFAEQLGIDASTVTDERTLDDLGMDDLDSVELVMALEEEFDILIPEEEWCPMGDEANFTVKQVRELVQKGIAKRDATRVK